MTVGYEPEKMQSSCVNLKGVHKQGKQSRPVAGVRGVEGETETEGRRAGSTRRGKVYVKAESRRRVMYSQKLRMEIMDRN